MRTPHIGLLWQEFKERFPRTEEHPPLEPIYERFGVRPSLREPVRIQMLTTPPVPRCWFLNNEGTELIQVQQDRFIHNWRKADETTIYPRYEAIKTAFESEIGRFQEFLTRHGSGDLTPNQCEITYVNHIDSGEGWTTPGELNEVLTLFSKQYSDDFLSIPEDARLSARYVITSDVGEPMGRLHVAIEPAVRINDQQQIFQLTLTARGRPTGVGIEGVLKFLDIGREWIVRGFTSITTPKMHSIWRRRT